jgi:hypothetical protein
MQERVAQIGGTLTVQSNGQGTSVLVALPTVQKVRPGQGMALAEDDDERGNQKKKAGYSLAERCVVKLDASGGPYLSGPSSPAISHRAQRLLRKQGRPSPSEPLTF